MAVPNFGNLNLSSLIGAPKKVGASPVDTYGTVVPGSSPATPAMNVGPMGQLPPYLLNQAAGNLSSELSGQLPADVQNMLSQQAAEYGVASGTGGSQFSGYRGLRNLGLTSLDLSKHATDLLAGQLTSPAEQARIDLANRGFSEGQREFGITQAQKEKEFQVQQDLAQRKFAAEQNALQRDLQLKDLQALGLKYGGGGVSPGGYTGITPGVDYHLSATSPGQWEPWQFGVTSMI